MQRGEIDLVIVGSDRTLGRTGEVANKIGTYTKAVLARRHGIPFYVAIPLSTIDWNLKCGFDIPIEERHESEVLGAWGEIRNFNPQSAIGTARLCPRGESDQQRAQSGIRRDAAGIDHGHHHTGGHIQAKGTLDPAVADWDMPIELASGANRN